MSGEDAERLVDTAVIEMRWGTDRLRIELRADGDGTFLTLVDTFHALGKAARDSAGWHECLDRLALDLAGGQLPKWGGQWRELNSLYVERFGPDAATIGPPEGWDDGS